VTKGGHCRKSSPDPENWAFASYFASSIARLKEALPMENLP
jgi:hypothetical protein